MTIPERNLNNSRIVDSLFTGTGINPFNINKSPFVKQRSMTHVVPANLNKLYNLAPINLVKNIRTLSDDWSLNGVNLNPVKDKLIKDDTYGFLTNVNGEGITLWGILPDDKWSGKEGLLELDGLIKENIKSRKWRTAYQVAKDSLGTSNPPFRPVFAATVTVQEEGIPFFGRVAWGVAVANDIVSLTQIPTMNGNRSDYFTWSFASKDFVTEDELYKAAGGKNGGEGDYTRFAKFRTWLSENCAPLNPKGEYPFAKGNEKPIDHDDKDAQPKPGEAPKDQDTSSDQGDTKSQDSQSEENPLIQASKEINKESLELSINKSRLMAEVFLKRNNTLINEYSLYNDEDNEDPDYIGKDNGSGGVDGDKSTYPSGKPYVNKLKVNADGVPNVGPIY